MYLPARWLVIASLLAGCAGSRGETRGPANGETALTMALRVDASAADGSQERVLKPSEPLHTGDKIALGIDVDRPASVYVAQVLPEGKLDLLFSQTGEQQLMPGQALRFPSQGQWLQPEGDTAEETLFVVASTRPFAQLEQELCRSLNRSPCSLASADRPTGTRGTEANLPPPPPPPPRLDISTRTLRDAGYNQRVSSDKNGVAVLRIVLRHEH